MPLNEASWLNLTVHNPTSGQTFQADPGNNYRTTVINTVTNALNMGLLVILDLHWAAPGTYPPLAQNLMANTDHSTAFWTSVANAFKSMPGVIFELYNEPFFFYWNGGVQTYYNTSADEWTTWSQGGGMSQFVWSSGPTWQNTAWTALGMSGMLSAVRATGSTNVVLLGGVDWCNDLSGWLAHVPSDPAGQLAAAWHNYEGSGHSPSSFWTIQEAILQAGYPLVITETGDNIGSSSWVQPLVAWADNLNVSYLGWTFNAWSGSSDILITNADGTPTAGYGAFWMQHLQQRAAATPPSAPSPVSSPTPVASSPSPAPTSSVTPNQPSAPSSAALVCFSAATLLIAAVLSLVI